jgi:glutathione gamma-glutamylcysteinyltransferase
MKGTFISSSRLLTGGKGRCPCSQSPFPPSEMHNAKSSRRVASKLRQAAYCSMQSPQHSHNYHYLTQYSADVSHRWRMIYSSQNLIGINRSMFSAVAMDDEVDNHTMSSSELHHPHDASPRHCRTCTCNNLSENKLVDNLDGDRRHLDHTTSSSPTTCYLPEPLIAPNTPLPPPAPKPEYSFKSRILPPNLIAFDSSEGKSRFLHCLQTNNAEAYFPLSQQFVNQMDPAYCGVSTLLLILNALAIDPNVRWRGGWRWYGDESMLLERCCLEEERVRREGITLEQYCGLARCQGVELIMKRPKGIATSPNQDGVFDDNTDTTGVSLEQFRQDVINAVNFPPITDRGSAHHSNTDDVEPNASQNNRGYFLVTSFARSALHQTGEGHFSPIAAYHPPTDSCLVLDVARFKYAPYFVDLKELYDAMIPADKLTGKSRGWILMKATKKNRHHGKQHHPMTKEELEGKRPAACVPLAGSGEYICPVEKIKIEYCSVGK